MMLEESHTNSLGIHAKDLLLNSNIELKISQISSNQVCLIELFMANCSNRASMMTTNKGEKLVNSSVA